MDIKTVDETAIYSNELASGKLPKYESTNVPSQTTGTVETNHTKKRYEQRKWGNQPKREILVPCVLLPAGAFSYRT